VVDPAVDWVREIDTDLVGCVFRVMIRAGGGLGKGRGGGGGGLERETQGEKGHWGKGVVEREGEWDSFV